MPARGPDQPAAAERTAAERGAALRRSPELLLRTNGGCDLYPGRLLEVFGRQRQRFAAVLREFGPGDWSAPTRCAAWSAHDVVRHLCDGTMKLGAMRPGDRTLDLSAGFDPRITPRGWPAISATESPGATLTRLLASTDELLAVARDRLARGHRFDVHLPYGPMDWTVLVLHGFWDSWLHERDILLARDREHPTDGDATRYATGYGLFMAAAVAAMSGRPVQEKLELGGCGGGVFEVDSRGAVMLHVTQAATAGPPAAETADALAGRSPIAAVLGDLPASSRAALARMGDFFNTPVRQGC
jgi:uncharacterized protein (TIGR03083 family)